MPKTYIVHIGERYPFNFSNSQPLQPNSVVKIKRQIKIRQISKELSSKMLFVNNLRNKNLIKIECIDETSQTVQIGYEYIQMENAQRSPQFWNAASQQLQAFTSYLTNIGVKTNLSIRRMGMTKQGTLKYYLGLQFQLSQNEEQEIIRDHYQLQLQQIKKQCNCYSDEYHNQMSVVPYGQFDCTSASQMFPQKMRKASLVTLPSKMPNLSQLSKELSKIKSSVRQITQFHFKQQGKEGYKTIHNYQIYQAIPKTKISMPLTSNFKKETNRKYSGDNKAIMSSNRKLSTKFSDFKSDRSKTKQISHQISQFNGDNTKSKVQQLKYKQYIQIVSSKGNYLKDFINVLQDSPPSVLKSQSVDHSNLCATPKSPSKHQYSSTASSSFTKNQTQMLKIKAQQSIKNSLKIINKVRGHN